MPRKRVKSVSPSDVLDQLRQYIENGDMQPGERLPSERTLAQEFRVGRPSVREAIKALQILDVLDSRHGDGTFVKSRAGLSGGWPSQVDLNPGNIDLIELLEVRKMIEPTAAALSAARRNEKQLAAMEAEVVAQEKRPDDRENLVRHDYLFHEEILQAAGNRVLQDVSRFLAPLLQRSRKLTGRSTPNPRIAIQQHRVILEAIRRRDPDIAEEAMRTHLQTVGLDLIAQTSSQKRS
jgi:GntR family transcriptional regulator, transcriptional repressor for pyruvate dehydrogenase complex